MYLSTFYVLKEVLKYFMSWLYCTCTCTYNMDLCTCDVLKYFKKYLNPCLIYIHAYIYIYIYIYYIYIYIYIYIYNIIYIYGNARSIVVFVKNLLKILMGSYRTTFI